MTNGPVVRLCSYCVYFVQTTFKYDNLVIKTGRTANSVGRVSVDVTNTGTVSGVGIPQLYLGLPISAGEPTKKLIERTKTPILRPGATTTVHFSLMDYGTFQVFVGTGSEDIRVTGTLHV